MNEQERRRAEVDRARENLRRAQLAAHGSQAAAKTAAALRLVAEGRRLVWTDDDLDDLCPGLWPAAVRALQPAPDDELRTPRAALYVDERMLLVRPESRRGLRPEHLDAIETFVGGGGG